MRLPKWLRQPTLESIDRQRNEELEARLLNIVVSVRSMMVEFQPSHDALNAYLVEVGVTDVDQLTDVQLYEACTRILRARQNSEDGG